MAASIHTLYININLIHFTLRFLVLKGWGSIQYIYVLCTDSDPRRNP